MYQTVYDYVEIQGEELKRQGAVEAQLRNGRRKSPSLGYRLRESGGNALITLGKSLKPRRPVGQAQFIAATQSALRSR